MTLVKTSKETESKGVLPSIFSDFFDSDRFFDFNLPALANRMPAVNIKENNNEFQVELAAPGLKKEDFKVKIDNHTLTISAEKETSSESKEEKFTRKEYSYNSFTRSFTLPDYVKSDEITAKYEDGVLRLMLPKKEEARKNGAKQIRIS